MQSLRTWCASAGAAHSARSALTAGWSERCLIGKGMIRMPVDPDRPRATPGCLPELLPRDGPRESSFVATSLLTGLRGGVLKGFSSEGTTAVVWGRFTPAPLSSICSYVKSLGVPLQCGSKAETLNSRNGNRLSRL